MAVHDLLGTPSPAMQSVLCCCVLVQVDRLGVGLGRAAR